MFTIITANALLVWFVWGFCMALGWVLGTWIMEWPSLPPSRYSAQRAASFGIEELNRSLTSEPPRCIHRTKQ
jgi:hypothetical protein